MYPTVASSLECVSTRIPRRGPWEHRSRTRGARTALLAAALGLALGACTPTVRVEPITVNLNVKIDHEVRIKVDKELDSLFDEKSDIF